MERTIADVLRAAESLIEKRDQVELSPAELKARLKEINRHGMLVAIDTENRLASITVKLWS